MDSSDDLRARHPVLGVTLVVCAAALFAVNGTVSKVVMANGLSALQLVQVRCLLATVVFAAIAAVREPRSLQVNARELALLAVFGIVGVAMVQWLYLIAISRMPVSVTLLIEFTAPLQIALWIRFVRKQPVRNRLWWALALIITGLALVGRVWAGLTLDAFGLLCAWIAAAALAFYYLIGERAVGRRNPWAVATWSFASASAVWAVMSPWWTFPFHQLSTSVSLGDVITVPAGVAVGYVALLGTVAPFGMVFTALGMIGATRVGLLGTSEPLIAGVVAWLVIGETLLPVQLIGAAVVLAGIVLAETARPSPTAVPAGSSGAATGDEPPAATGQPHETMVW